MMVRLLWRVASGVLRRRVSGWLREKQWFIAYGRGSAPPTTIMPPPGRFYADPFLFQRDGRRYVFFEDYDGTSGRADICYLEIDEHGRHCSPQLALRQDCHLSYPFVFTEGDDVYMLPETAGHRTVELYRAARFPDEWTLERVLLRTSRRRTPHCSAARTGGGSSSRWPSTAAARSTSSACSPPTPCTVSGSPIPSTRSSRMSAPPVQPGGSSRATVS
jgi:hypothetical protein